MPASQWLSIAYGPCMLVVFVILGYIGIRYSQGRELSSRTRLRLLGVAAVFLGVAAVFLVAGGSSQR